MGGTLRKARGSSGPKVPAKALSAKVSQGTKILHTAVVVDVFSNPQMMSTIQKNLFKKGTTHGVAQASLVDSMPRNSIAAILIDNVGGKINPDPMIFYPFFSPHLAMPVKPGEKVLVIFNEATDPINLANINTQVLGYWMTRMSVDVDVDDVNYTHADRMHPQRVDESDLGGPSGTSSDDPREPLLEFPNGDGTPEGRTLAKESAYEDIVKTAFGNRLGAFATSPLSDAWGVAGLTVGMSGPVGAYEFTGEVVPRFTKNCSDLALQGSNNTLISLGEDITADLAGVGGTSALASVTGGRGAIDLVAGRGQGSTAPAAEKPNTRLYTETDKATENQNKSEGAPAGDDLSRVYISMKGTPALFGYDGGLSAGLTSAAFNEPFILAKSSAVRLVGNTVSMIAVGGSSAMQVSTGVADIQAFQTNINTSPTTMLMPITTGMGHVGYNVCRAGPVAYFETKMMGNPLMGGTDGYVGEILNLIANIMGTSIEGGALLPATPPGDPLLLLAAYGIIPFGLTLTGMAVMTAMTTMLTGMNGIVAYHAFKDANFILPIPGTNNNFGSPNFTCT